MSDSEGGIKRENESEREREKESKKVWEDRRERERKKRVREWERSSFLFFSFLGLFMSFPLSSLSLAKPEIVFWNFPRTKNQPQNCPRIDFFTAEKLGENLTTKKTDNFDLFQIKYFHLLSFFGLFTSQFFYFLGLYVIFVCDKD